MTTQTPLNLREAFRSVVKEARAYFAKATEECKAEEVPTWDSRIEVDRYWRQLSDATQEEARRIVPALLPLCAQLAEGARTSPLTGPEDVNDVKTATKRMRTALYLRDYDYREAEVVHDEGTVLGFRPATQSEGQGASPASAEAEFERGVESIANVLNLVEAAGPAATSGSAIQSSDLNAAKYKPNTAFIMMWMSPERPQLTDVADTIRTVFQSFGIRAVRADDIEHDGLITEQVLNEIRTAEFLVADLTGARPNVYYEVGFAHALNKRVVLFREKGTGLHFDLAGFNCPEYSNLKDLREKLTKRLVHLTNRNPSSVAEI